MKAVLNTKTIAKLLDVSERRVQQLKKEGMPGGHGKWPFLPCLHWYINFLRKGGQFGTAADERRRLEKAKADIAELELDQRRRDVIRKREVKQDITRIFSVLRGEFQGYPGRFSANVIALLRSEIKSLPPDVQKIVLNIVTQRKAKALLDEETRKTLNRTADILDSYGDKQPDYINRSHSAASSGKKKSMRLGGTK